MIADFKLKDSNSNIVDNIEKSAKNNIKHTLDGVFDFMNRHANNNPNYKVFKEQFVLCWSGVKKTINHETYYSRVDIEMVTEVLKSDFLTQGPFVKKVEDSMALLTSKNFGVMCSNGTAALHLVAEMLNQDTEIIDKNIITTPLTFVADANFGRYFMRCSSLPYFQIGYITKED